MDVSITGTITREISFERAHNGNVRAFEGPDVLGNGCSCRRYLFITQHFYGEPVKTRSRDACIDNDFSSCVIWQFYEGNKERYTTFGVLEWIAGDTVLEAPYVG